MRNLVALSLIGLLLASTALAQTSSSLPSSGAAAASVEEGRKADAEHLFEEAKALIAKDEWGPACALFDASAELQEVSSALVKVARCRVHEGHFVKGLAAYERALALRPPVELERLVRAELFEARGRAPSIRITLVEPARGVTLRRNGEPISSDAMLTPLPTDAGTAEHFTADAHGYISAIYDVKASAEAEVLEVRVDLEKEPPPPAPRIVTVVPPPDVRRIAGYSLAAASAVSLGFAIGFGAQFFAQKSSLFADCTGVSADGRHVCPDGTTTRYDDLMSARTRAEVLAVVGGAGAALGIVILATAPRTKTSPTVTIGAGRLYLRGEW